jgi:glucose-6-phosphate dehydrogenase assembly protein OpcA
VPDIPTILLWKADITADDPVLLALATMADRVLIDSSEDPEPLRLLRSMGAYVRTQRPGALYGDLAWSHATAWRTALAQAFGPEDVRQYLSSISSLDISVSSSSDPTHNGISQALLLLGWLSSRLGWSVLQPVRLGPNNSFAGVFTRNGMSITATVVRQAARLGGPGGLEEVRMNLSAGTELVLTSGDDRSCIRTRLTTGTGPARESILWVRDRGEASVVARELEMLDRDELYDSASEVLALLLRTV